MSNFNRDFTRRLNPGLKRRSLGMIGRSVRCFDRTLKDLVARASQFLGSIHGNIRVSEKFLRTLVASGRQGNPDARSNGNNLRTEKHRGFQFSHDTVGNTRSVAEIAYVVQKDGKLI